MEFENKSENKWKNFKNKELIGTGSNGNRVYKSINSKDNKVIKN
jgi:hypothetical protein